MLKASRSLSIRLTSEAAKSFMVFARPGSDTTAWYRSLSFIAAVFVGRSHHVAQARQQFGILGAARASSSAIIAMTMFRDQAISLRCVIRTWTITCALASTLALRILFSVVTGVVTSSLVTSSSAFAWIFADRSRDHPSFLARLLICYVRDAVLARNLTKRANACPIVELDALPIGRELRLGFAPWASSAGASSLGSCAACSAAAAWGVQPYRGARE